MWVIEKVAGGTVQPREVVIGCRNRNPQRPLFFTRDDGRPSGAQRATVRTGLWDKRQWELWFRRDVDGR
jgi:hypothetical protein